MIESNLERYSNKPDGKDKFILLSAVSSACKLTSGAEGNSGIIPERLELNSPTLLDNVDARADGSTVRLLDSEFFKLSIFSNTPFRFGLAPHISAVLKSAILFSYNPVTSSVPDVLDGDTG